MSDVKNPITIQFFFCFTVIRDEFRVLPQNTKALVGETATLKCQPPKGTPEPQVLWQKSGQSIDTRLAT